MSSDEEEQLVELDELDEEDEPPLIAAKLTSVKMKIDKIVYKILFIGHPFKNISNTVINKERINLNICSLIKRDQH